MEPLSELWEANLFGFPRVRCGERSTDHFQTRQTALLFAYLVTHPRRYPRDELVDLLWPDADPESGRRRLSQALWRIRQTLHELCPDAGREGLIADRNAVGIDPEQINSDVALFRQCLHRAARPDNTARVQALEQAVAVYGEAGGFLIGFYDDWVLSERQTLLSDYLAALEAITCHFEATGDWPKAQASAERAVAADPLVEDSHRTLIRILAASGQTAAAQRHYGDLARLLARELNSEPSEMTRALMAQMQRAVDAAPAPPATTSEVVAPMSPLQVAPLPVPLTTFFGRETFLREIRTLLDDPATRLITLLGTGGIGKTRLALELARGVAAWGVEPAAAFVSLAEIMEPPRIADSIADALTPLREAPALQRITAALTTSPAAPPFLLVLDNAEHLAEPVGATVTELLARIPRLRVLVTSQRSLGVSGEHEVMLAPLELPRVGLEASPSAVSARPAADDPGLAPSVRLFLDRAKSVRPGFPTDAASLADVARICERLEGLPLAIELCAGWAQTLGARQMLEMLARRFELLVSRRTDIPARHRTLRAAIEYSYIQLSEPMQEFLVRLSVFRNGWTLAAAADVCTGGSVPAALAMLAQMRERSLIVADEVRAGDGMRYKMLESLRDFAAEQRTMAQAQQHGEAHAAYFARFVEETVARMQGREDVLWAARLDDEMENIRAALEHLTAGREIETAWMVTAAVSRAWNGHGHARETRHWTGRALAMADPLTGEGAGGEGESGGSERTHRLQRLRARLLTVQADALHILSDYAGAAAGAEQALAIWQELGDPGGMTECLDLMGIIAMLNNDFDRAQALLAQALPSARALGDFTITAHVLNDLGRVAMALQDWPTASERLIESLTLRRTLADARYICSCLGNLGLVSRYQGDYAVARALLQEAVSLQSRHGFVWISSIDLNLATVERLDGRYAESLQLLAAARSNAQARGERRVVAWCVKEMGHLAVALKQYALGLRLLSCAEALRAAIGMSFKPLGPQDIERDRTASELALGVSEAAANWTLGASADPEALLAEAQAALAERIEADRQTK